jgi:hypothetical protein
MPCYRFLLDTPVPVPHELAATLAAALDRHLSKNAIYSVHRLAGLIGPPEVRVLSPGTFAAYRMRRRELGLATLAQQKHRIILAPEDEAAILGLSNDLSSTEGAAS